MAPLLHILALLVLSTLALASPHVSRHLHARHALRPAPQLDVPDVSPLAPPKRKRSLNKRCIPRPSNGTSSALPSNTAPVNVAPSPSLASSSLPADYTSTPTSAPQTSSTPYVPPSSTEAATTSSTPTTYVPPSSSEAATTPTTSSTPTTYVPPSSSEAATTPTTSSTPTPYVPPSSTEAATTSTPAPTPTPTPTPTTSSTPAPAQTSSSASDSNEPYYMIGTQTGSGTYYDAGLGACGITNTNSDNIVAVSELLYDSYPGADSSNPNNNPVCNKPLTIHYGGASVSAIVTDRCVACAETDLDMTPGVFSQLAQLSVGRIKITWDWD